MRSKKVAGKPLTVEPAGKIPLRIAQEHLQAKYADAFSFFLTKVVNQIVEEMKTPQEILYYDYLVFDDRQEIMRRFYSTAEAQVRLRNYTDYYADLPEYQRPCYERVSNRQIMAKRRQRLAKVTRRREEQGREEGQAGETGSTVLKDLHQQTMYLQAIDVKKAVKMGAKKTEKTTGRGEAMTQRGAAHLLSPGEVHDIYDPKFSSEEEGEGEEGSGLGLALDFLEQREVGVGFGRHCQNLNLSIESTIAAVDLAGQSEIVSAQHDPSFFTQTSLFGQQPEESMCAAEDLPAYPLSQIELVSPVKLDTPFGMTNRSLKVDFIKKSKAEVPPTPKEGSPSPKPEKGGEAIFRRVASISQINSTIVQTIANNFDGQPRPARDSVTRSKIIQKPMPKDTGGKSASRITKRKDAPCLSGPISPSGLPRTIDFKKKRTKLAKNVQKSSGKDQAAFREPFFETPFLNDRKKSPLAPAGPNKSRNSSLTTPNLPKARFRNTGLVYKVFQAPREVAQTPNSEAYPSRSKDPSIGSSPMVHPIRRWQSPPIGEEARRELSSKAPPIKIKLPETFRPFDHVISTLKNLQINRSQNKENNLQPIHSRFNITSPKTLLPKNPASGDRLLGLTAHKPSILALTANRTPKGVVRLPSRLEELRSQARSLKMNLNPKQLAFSVKGGKNQAPFFHNPINFQQMLAKGGARKADFKFMTMVPSTLCRSKCSGTETGQPKDGGWVHPVSVKNIKMTHKMSKANILAALESKTEEVFGNRPSFNQSKKSIKGKHSGEPRGRLFRAYASVEQEL